MAWLLLSGSDLSPQGRAVAAIGVLMAAWWMTEALPLSATALLPIVLFPVFGVLSVEEATAPYANPIVFLFMGGFLIAIAMQKWNLHRRIALHTVHTVGTHPRQIVLGMMIATAFLSMWVSNTATTLMMLPIALSVLSLVVERTGAASGEQSDGEGDSDVASRVRGGETVSEVVSDSSVRIFGVGLVLSIAWAASIGGLGTLLGSPPNAIVAAYISEELGRDIGFLEWMILGVPLVVTFIAIAWLLVTRVLFRSDLEEIPGGKAMIEEEIEKLGPVSRGEKLVLVVFLSAAFLWIVPGLLSSIGAVADAAPWLGTLDDTAIGIAAGISLFLIPAEGRRTMVLTWTDAQKGLPWGVLLLFGGGLSLAAATFVPVLGGVAAGIGVDGVTLLIPAALAATCAFMLPVGTPPNAIVFGSGAVTISQMARGGAVLNIVGVLLITTFAAAIGTWALGMEFF